MKAYTDIEQSKKLAEILPLESADMFYRDNEEDVKLMWEHLSEIKVTSPCWSLAALLSILPYKIELSHDVIDTSGNIAYKNECYKLSINRCGLFGDKWNVQYYGKHQRQLGKRYKELYIDLFLTKNHDNLVDACVEMILKLHEQNFL